MKSREAEMICLLRGSYSQQKMNDKLEFEYNKYANWERGRTKVLWKDFVHICSVLNINLKEVIFDCYGFNGEPEDIRDYFSFLWGGKTQKKIAIELNMTREQVRRIVNGQKNLELATCNLQQFLIFLIVGPMM